MSLSSLMGAILQYEKTNRERFAPRFCVLDQLANASCRHNRGNPSRTLGIKFMASTNDTPLSRALSATATQALISEAASTMTTPRNRPRRLR